MVPMRKFAKRGTKSGAERKGRTPATIRDPDFWQKKLHAAKVNLKRAIKKAKDLHVRKLVKRLKAKQTDALDAELRRAKEVDVEGLWTAVLEGTMGGAGDASGQVENVASGGVENGNDATADDVRRRLARSEGVVQQLAVVSEMREKLEQARRAGEEPRAGAEVTEVTEVDADVGNTDKPGEEEQSERAGARERTKEEEKEEMAETIASTTTTTKDRKRVTPDEDTHASQKAAMKKNQKEKKKEKKKPKNRMGQRARQRLAEKQYGKDNALHIVENRARDQKRREQQERTRERGVEGGPYHGKDNRGDPNRKRQRNDPKAPAKDDPATLHPSWQAKKALTQKVVIPDISANASKNKIVFD